MAGSGQETPGAEPSEIYGPDDPAYGPPPPGWYQRGDEDGPRTENASLAAESAEQASEVRGPFEPLRPVGPHEAGQQEAGQQDPGHQDPGHQDPGQQESAEPDQALDDALADEADLPDFLDFGPPTDPDAGTLGGLRDMYLTAEAISPARLERHFDELLEKQRKLISDYFKESAGLAGADASGASTPFGFDSADSLAALRGELRST